MNVNMVDCHEPVMLKELLEALQIKPAGCYLDATYGRGGHSRAALERLGDKGRLFAFDKDPSACRHARDFFANEPRFAIQQASFTHAADFLASDIRFDGVFFDLGVSTPQLMDAQRGFSFQKNGPLDMRMCFTEGYPISEWLNSASQNEIKKVLSKYGEERKAERIAREIKRDKTPQTTFELVELVKKAAAVSVAKRHPATRVFLALRMYINRELEELQEALESTPSLLKKGGKLAIIAFNSLEDRIVKNFMRAHGKKRSKRQIKSRGRQKETSLRANKTLLWNGKCLPVSAEEVANNPRSRSARLRVAEKTV